MSLMSDWGAVRSLQPEQWLSILYLSLMCSCLGYFLWNFSLSVMEAVKATVWLYIEPVATFVGEALIFSVFPTTVDDRTIHYTWSNHSETNKRVRWSVMIAQG